MQNFYTTDLIAKSALLRRISAFVQNIRAYAEVSFHEIHSNLCRKQAAGIGLCSYVCHLEAFRNLHVQDKLIVLNGLSG
jgi:hypothetical protein